MSKMVIKFPSRNRPEKFKNALGKFVSYLSGDHEIEFIITMDTDDPTMNNDAMREYLDGFTTNPKYPYVSLKYYYGDSKTKIEAINADLEDTDGDVLMVLSDDMIPVKKRYDDIIFDVYRLVFPDFDGAVKFHDGLRSQEDALMTISIMGFPLYRQFGYVYHPSYTSLYADNEQTNVCYMIGKYTKSPECIIKHEWTKDFFDDLHARNECDEMYHIDGKIYQERRSKFFDVLNVVLSDGTKLYKIQPHDEVI